MKMLILIAALAITGCSSTPYVKLGIGYEFHRTELEKNPCDSKISGRAEVGFMFDSYTIGISHKSQPMCGWPSNDLNELVTDQIFIDKTWTF